MVFLLKMAKTHRYWKSVWLALGLLLLLASACTSTSPTHGQWYPGGPLAINIQELLRVPELHFQRDELNYVIRPEEGNELVALHLLVRNREADRLYMTVDDQSVELRGFDDDKYLPLDYMVRGAKLEGDPDLEIRFEPFIWGKIELPKDYQVDGWLIFEVPKGTKLRQMKWVTGGPVFIDL